MLNPIERSEATAMVLKNIMGIEGGMLEIPSFSKSKSRGEKKRVLKFIGLIHKPFKYSIP